ncbi:Mlp family lipoprotein [Borrelia persica]|uniref:Mlp family lipoprotein n=1 Tax=Borrelia persica TaxID=44448 RepID=UPI000464AB67|nr:Mlp family lipoprotein [Borrelia persica]
MKTINIILILLLLMNSCDQYRQKNNSDDKLQKDSGEQTEEIQKKLEEILREELNDTEKANLDFLKNALDNENDFNKFLSSDQSEIKSVLEHIKEQLKDCNGENAENQKQTFKQMIKAAAGNLDNIKQAQSMCNIRNGS